MGRRNRYLPDFGNTVMSTLPYSLKLSACLCDAVWVRRSPGVGSPRGQGLARQCPFHCPRNGTEQCWAPPVGHCRSPAHGSCSGQGHSSGWESSREPRWRAREWVLSLVLPWDLCPWSQWDGAALGCTDLLALPCQMADRGMHARHLEHPLSMFSCQTVFWIKG